MSCHDLVQSGDPNAFKAYAGHSPAGNAWANNPEGYAQQREGNMY